MKTRTLILVSAISLMSAVELPASIQLVGNPSNPHSSGLGNFSLNFTYAATNANSAVITLVLENTTPAANGGYLTALAFGNPSSNISSLTLGSTTLGTFNNVLGGVNVQPFGTHAFAVSSTNSWIGGGSPTGGIGVGNTATIVLNATGSNLNTITELDFLSALSSGGGGGQQSFIARFRGFANDGSDKVPGQLRVIPEPGSLLVWFASMGCVGLVGLRRHRRV